jgi:uncharacterized membrane protein
LAQQRIEVDQDFAFPVERLFAYLREHENLAPIFAAKIRRLHDGQSSRNGLGSARELRVSILPPFVETVTGYRENELIEYRITQGSPLKNHLGTMRFSSTPNGGSHLSYTIVFEGRLPFVAELIRPGLEKSVRQGLRDIRC